MRASAEADRPENMPSVRAFLALMLIFAACTPPARAPPADGPRVAAPAVDTARYRALFQAYLQVDTTNPPGHELRAAPLLTEALARAGVHAKVTPMPTAETATAGATRGNVWGILEAPRPEAKALILLHHIDVVPVERALWSTDPFSGEIKDGQIWGRGAIDTKSLGIFQLAALEYLAARKDRLRRNVVFLAVADEESGGGGAQLAVAQNLAQWDAEYLLDEGGFAIRDFMNDKDVIVIATAQKRTGKLILTARGEAGHGSRPVPGGGPNVLVEALQRIIESPPAMRLGPTTKKTFEKFALLAGGPKGLLLSHLDWPGVLPAMSPTLTKNKNLNPMLRDTLSLTILDAGQKANVIPAEATATLDVRLLPTTDLETFLADLKSLLEGLDVEIEVAEAPLPPFEPSPTDDPLYQALADATLAQKPDTVVAPWLMVGGSDSRFFAPRGIRTYGFNPAFMSKAQVDSIHGHNERMDVEAFAVALRTYIEALDRFLLRPAASP